MFKEFYNSLSHLEKDNVYNICFSIVFGWIMAYAYDKGFLICILYIYICNYIISTISYFRKYLTDDRRYIINIDNTQNSEYLCHHITLNLLNKKWEVSKSTTFSSPKNNDDWQQNKTDWV